MDTVLKVSLGDRSYSIEIGEGGLDRITGFVRNFGTISQIAVVTDENVNALFAERVVRSLTHFGYDVNLFVVPAGEESKSLGIAAELWDSFLERNIDRKSFVIALGGGVVGDLAGFIASTYARGIRLFQIPTTLLAQVDSSVGGKVAINIKDGKNMVGAFHQPCGVLIDPNTLTSLDNIQYHSGLGEVLKYGVSLDADFFAFLEDNVEAIRRKDSEVLSKIITHCCHIKADIVENDEKEEIGLRTLLNYGHTFAHAIESKAGYGRTAHGMAVSVGSIIAVKLAALLHKKGDRSFVAVDDVCVERQVSLYRRLEMPTTLQDLEMNDIPTHALIEQMSKDKKTANGQIGFVLPIALGKCKMFTDVSLADVQEVVDKCRSRASIF